MTASRTCRACGASLTGGVMWCARCYEPVRHLTPREAPLPLATAVAPRPEPERSRWKAGVNTFGPFGRIAITAIVVLMAPPTNNPVTIFVMWPCYLAVAVAVLRSTWKKDDVQTTWTAEQIAAAAPSEPVPEPHRAPVSRSTLVAWGTIIVAATALSIVLASSGHLVRTSIGISASLAAIVLWIRFSLRN